MQKNSGQVLVLFVLLLPILFMLMALVTDIGLFYIEKRKVDNVINEAIDYGFTLENDKNDRITNYITGNIDNIDALNINIDDDTISVELQKNASGIFTTIFGNNNYQIISNWYGYKDNDKIKIVKK